MLFSRFARSLVSINGLPIPPKPMVVDITAFSRRGSMGGLVTWANFCLKKSEKFRCCSEKAASGQSSPIDPTGSLPSFIIGRMIRSITSLVIL